MRRIDAWLWLKDDAPMFGFSPYEVEPWHWSYNPIGLERPGARTTNSRAAALGQERRRLHPSYQEISSSPRVSPSGTRTHGHFEARRNPA
jgi:hypothetical protein